MNAETIANCIVDEMERVSGNKYLSREKVVNELKKADCDLLSKRLSEAKEKDYKWYCDNVLPKARICQNQ